MRITNTHIKKEAVRKGRLRKKGKKGREAQLQEVKNLRIITEVYIP
jgi:hypothetical protein